MKKDTKNQVRIFDTTLRDGEQCPGATMNIHEKLEVARQLQRLNVDIIEAGFPIASNGDFDAVLTMYHDQGQIAMKLMGFDRGVTLIGGFPFPICTPAHGTAYEIAGKGIANLGATRAALSLAIKMASEGKAARKAA